GWLVVWVLFFWLFHTLKIIRIKFLPPPKNVVPHLSQLPPLSSSAAGNLHLDPEYKLAEDPLKVCPSAGTQPVANAGAWGDYLCDAPWILVNSSIYAMKKILPDPDFILWTGDDTPHVPNERLGEEVVLEIIGNLTNLIKHVFPGAFYSQMLSSPGPAKRMIVLNTNLYYENNNQTGSMEDPAGQFHWLEDILTNASKAGEKVYIIGHVPPGFFEKKRGKPWFREHFNQRYIEIIQKHHGVIMAQFFGHHHTDSFRMFYSDTGIPTSVMFLAPAVTPWKTTLPGVHNGANNPGIRVFTYDHDTLLVKDMVTYYLNLTHANLEAPRWDKEYSLTEDFQIPDGSVHSMQLLLEKLGKDRGYLQQYYHYNSVQYDLSDCDGDCQTDHICAIMEVDFAKYNQCIQSRSTAAASSAPMLVFLFLCSVFGLFYSGFMEALSRFGHEHSHAASA
uniref:Sphingomyelin phosphodiesterase acid like 3B n=1 Tax=Salvator merianae TaxID=96440 RepID=A0A8D0B2A7_SALMN